MLTLSIVLFALLLSEVYSFSLSHFPIESRCHALQMGGGRSLEEKKFTKKMMFKDLRDKLNAAAEIPGFFDVGAGAPVIALTINLNELLWK